VVTFIETTYVKTGPPNHKFWLVKKDTPYEKLYGQTCSLKISDDIVRYISDHFFWFKTLNPVGKNFSGLNYEGITIINQDIAPIFERTCFLLSELFEMHPNPVILRSHDIHEVSEQEIGFCDYETDRNKLVRDLRELANFARITAKGEHKIIHFGL